MRTKPDLERLAKEAGLSRVFAVFQGERASTVVRGYDASGQLRQVVLEDESVMSDEQVRDRVREILSRS